MARLGLEGRSTGRGCESEDRALLRILAHGVIVRTEAAQGEDTMQRSQLFGVSLLPAETPLEWEAVDWLF
jgi:hypothetical protein